MTIEETTNELNKTVFTNMTVRQFAKQERISMDDSFRLAEAISQAYIDVCLANDWDQEELLECDIERFVANA